MYKERRGSTSMVMGLTLPVLVGFVAMGVDYGAIAVARHQVQSAADSAALVATTAIGDLPTATFRAEAYAGKYNFAGNTITVNEVTFGYWDDGVFDVNGDFNSVRVRAEAEVPLYFTSLFGFNSVTVRAESGAAPKVMVGRAPDLVIALDVTGSMSASELAAERIATVELLECINEKSLDTSRVSILLFTGVDYVQVDMTALEDGYDALLNVAEGVSGCGSAGAPPCSGTNPAAGLAAALEVLAASNTPEDIGQAVLLMSDGLPNARNICNQPFYDREEQGLMDFNLQEHCSLLGVNSQGEQIQPTNTDYRNWAQQYQALANVNDVDVYTVYYGTNSMGEGFLEDNIVAGEGYSEVALSSGDISDAFTDICLTYTVGSAGLIF